jgi:hypothetical protein
VITEFLFYDSPFTEQLCKVKHFNEYNEEWLDFVIANRNPMLPMHDFDIVEGPVANDRVQTRIFDFLKGNISKSDFLNELKYHEETHQICFCTLKSLLTLENENQDKTLNIIHISEPIVEQLMLDKQIDELVATDLFYNSAIFVQLTSETTKLYELS